MKMTMNIDEDVLARVMKVTGAKTKTKAVEMALADMARRHKMKELFTSGLGLSAEELKTVFDPASVDVPEPVGLVAEKPATYGRRRPAR